jgi:hypothetical protein
MELVQVMAQVQVLDKVLALAEVMNYFLLFANYIPPMFN